MFFNIFLQLTDRIPIIKVDEKGTIFIFFALKSFSKTEIF